MKGLDPEEENKDSQWAKELKVTPVDAASIHEHIAGVYNNMAVDPSAVQTKDYRAAVEDDAPAHPIITARKSAKWRQGPP